MTRPSVTTNYAWLPHNVDSSIPTPFEYHDMPIQPLGHRQQFYEEWIQQCVKYYGTKGSMCLDHEMFRLDHSTVQPKVRTVMVLFCPREPSVMMVELR